VQPIANAWLVGDLTCQLNVSLAVAGQSQVQLSLQRGELRRAGQTLVKRTKLAQERNELLGDKRAINSAAKSANANSNLNRQPIVVVILADGRTLVAQNLYLDALML
jgi:hypothetical protein